MKLAEVIGWAVMLVKVTVSCETVPSKALPGLKPLLTVIALPSVTLALPEPPELLTPPPGPVPVTAPPGIWFDSTAAGAPLVGVWAQKVMVHEVAEALAPPANVAIRNTGTVEVLVGSRLSPVQDAPPSAGGAGVVASRVMPTGRVSMTLTLVRAAAVKLLTVMT